MSSLKDLVDEWLRLDQNETTRTQVQSLWQAGNISELERRMRVRIEFGTAGLRGKMEAGWARMNDLTVIQASQGLCAYVMEQIENAASRGIRPCSFPKCQKTWCCLWCHDHSHNPKQDNGYKVYWENAVQIISPHDEGISNSIKANLQPRSWDLGVLATPLLQDPTDQMLYGYIQELSRLCQTRILNGTTGVKFVNTSMHGVSDKFVSEAFTVFGFAPYLPVTEQQQPDPEFPTVKFPNPEEKGALDLAFKTAEREGAMYVLAQDPDSDRFSAAERGTNGAWIKFTGDQLGVIFGHRTLELYRSSGKSLDKLAMVASTVSSKMLETVARIEGFKFVECLTGFKFIGNTALDLVKMGYEVPFGYEEAIGYMFGSEIRDKDGVAATVSFAEIVTALHGQGKTVNSYLQELYGRYGYFQTSNSYFICTDPPTIDKIFARIRSYPSIESQAGPSYPREIAGLTVTSVVDLTTGYDSTNPPSCKPSLPLSSGHMIQFRAENAVEGTKIVLTTRTSGTEPKIKYYLEGSGKNTHSVATLLPKVVAELGDVWLEADKHGLGYA
ncbi:Phosphoglucomutase-2 [Termitomyces sp. T112]|nr:Phosphoglucomutase-2 [Termitomyces sp. T112]